MERRRHQRWPLELAVELHMPLASLRGQSRDAGQQGLNVAVPSVRLRFSPSSLLEAPPFGLLIDSEEVAVSLKWYTLDESDYLLGLEVAAQDLERWRSLLARSAAR